MSQLFSGKDNLRRFSQQPATLLSLTCDGKPVQNTKNVAGQPKNGDLRHYYR